MSGEKIRLFVALELPAHVRTALAQWALGVKGSGLRVVAESSLHVTLCFLGWRGSGELDDIAAACSVLAGTGGAPLSLTEGLWLPRRRPRVLAAGLADADGALASAEAKLSAALTDGGWYEPEKRPFLPHVTVARVRRGERVRARALPPVPALTFQGTRVILFQSRLGPEGARYEPQAYVALTGS